MERFKERESLAGTLQPGDMTKYEMVAVRQWDTIQVAVLNHGFADIITFMPDEDHMVLHSIRGDMTNPWTIKAAREMAEMLDKKIKGEKYV